jgi:hypothetical protein
MALGRERMARLRQKRRAYGERAIEVWLDDASAGRLADLRRPGERDSQVIRRALLALEVQQALPPVTSDTTQKRPPVTSDRHSATSDAGNAQTRFIDLWNQGLETKAIAAQLGIAWTAAQSRARRLQEQGLIAPRPRGGDYPNRRAQARRTDGKL